MATILQAVEQGQMDLMQALPITQIIYEHCNMHLEQIAPDIMIQERVASYRQALQQAGEIIWNGQKKLMKMQRDGEQQAMEGEEGQPQQQQDTVDDDMRRKLIEFQTKLQMKQEESAVKRQIMLEDAAAKRQIEMAKAQQQAALTDAKTAAGILAQTQQRLQ